MKHALLQEYGVMMNHKRVYRLMKCSNNLSSVKVKKKRYLKGNNGVLPNLLKGKNFADDRACMKFGADVTEFKHGSGKIYLSVVKDMYTRMIEGYVVSNNQSEALILSTIEEIKNKSLPGTIFHSDQGSIYGSYEVQKLLKENFFRQSMSKSGTPTDNAPTESFFGTLKSETIYNEKCGCDDIVKTVKDFIYYYNNERIQKSLGYLTPMQFKKRSFETENFEKQIFETENFNNAMHY